MVLPTHYYEKIIEKLGGNPAELPDRCECTMVDQIVNLIDNGIEGGGGGGGGFVVHLTRDADYNAHVDKTYAEICEAAKTQPVHLIEEFSDGTVQHLNLIYFTNEATVYAAAFIVGVTNPDDMAGVSSSGIAYTVIGKDNSVYSNMVEMYFPES